MTTINQIVKQAAMRRRAATAENNAPVAESKAKAPRAKAKKGRPIDYSPELAAVICERISLGEGLTEICAAPGMPSVPTVYRWIQEREGFRAMHARAELLKADALFDAIGDIREQVRNGTRDASDARIIIDALKWQAARLAPHKYGDRTQRDANAGDTLVDALERIASDIYGK